MDDAFQNLQTPKEPSDAFPWPENFVAEKIGCTLPKLVQARMECLTRNVDFVGGAKKHVLYSTEGVRKIAKTFGLTLGDLAWVAPAGPPKLPVVELTVLRTKTLNPRVLLATLDGVARLRVIVKTKVNFRAGMKMECELVGGDLYRFVGNHPRFPGKY